MSRKADTGKVNRKNNRKDDKSESFVEGFKETKGNEVEILRMNNEQAFKEAVHARPLEMYLEHISNSLCCDYLGTIIKGGCDRLSKSKSGYKKVRNGAYEIGKVFGVTGHFNKKQIDAYAAPETQKKQNSFLLSIILKIMNKVSWEKSLKVNGISRQGSFAKPYGK